MLAYNDGTYSASYTYDELNRVLSVATVYPFGAKAVSYTYDAVGNKVSVVYPDSIATVNYTYDTLNRLVTMDARRGTMDEVTQYAYDNASRLSKRTLPNGVYTDYSYDNVHRLVSLVNKKSDGSVISSFSYTHDNVGNRVTMDARRGTMDVGTHNYTYDTTYRLTSADHPLQPDETYTYDMMGNRKTSAVHSTWTYDANNRLTSYNGTTLTYDNNGNTLTKTDASGTTTYTYDYENRLSNISGIANASYSYDPFGKRLSKTVDGVTKYYLYDNEDIIAEYDSSGNLITSYIHGQGIDEPISMTRDGITYYYIFDGLGSISELTDGSQSVTESYKYDAFGNLQTPPSTGNPYTYTGREYDSESGLYFYRARYYDAGVGRFLTEDPILERNISLLYFFQSLLNDPRQLNNYVYCLNNPINKVDPAGLISGMCMLKKVGIFTKCMLEEIREDWPWVGICGSMCVLCFHTGWLPACATCAVCAGVGGYYIVKCVKEAGDYICDPCE